MAAGHQISNQTSSPGTAWSVHLHTVNLVPCWGACLLQPLRSHIPATVPLSLSHGGLNHNHCRHAAARLP